MPQFYCPTGLETGEVIQGKKAVMTDFEVRPLETADYPRLVEIYHSNYPEDINFSADELRYDDETWDYKRYIQKQFVATMSGKVEGWASYWQSPAMYHPRKFTMNMAVDPLKQRVGIGSALYAQMLAELRRLEAILVRCKTRENLIAGKAFLQHRGFVEIHREWESHLKSGWVLSGPFQAIC